MPTAIDLFAGLGEWSAGARYITRFNGGRTAIAT